MTAEFMVDVRGVHKSFGALTVLDGVDLQVRHGEVTVLPSGRIDAYVGPNPTSAYHVAVDGRTKIVGTVSGTPRSSSAGT